MTFKNHLKYIFYVLLITVCLFAGLLSQQLEFRTLVFIIGFVGLWVLSILIFKPTVLTTLLFIAVYSLRPNPYGFYLCLLFLILSFLMELTGRDKPNLIIPFPIMLTVLMTAGIQAIINSKVFVDGFEYFSTTIFVPFLVISVIANSNYDEKNLEIWSKFIVIVAVILGFVGVVFALLNPISRIGSLWNTAMTINGFYTMGFFFGMGLLLIKREIVSKYIFTIFIIVIFLGMLYTYTRITLAAVAFGFFLLMLRVKNLRWFFFLFVLLTPLIIPSSMLQRINLVMTSDISLLIRIVAWYNALVQISRHFLLGIGFNTWEHIYTSWVPYMLLYARHPHNVYLRVMVETGIFGFLAYFGLIAAIMIKFFKYCVKPLHSKFDYAVFVAVAAVLFACITDVFIQQMGVSLPFWITLGLMYKKSLQEQLKTNPVL